MKNFETKLNACNSKCIYMMIITPYIYTCMNVYMGAKVGTLKHFFTCSHYFLEINNKAKTTKRKVDTMHVRYIYKKFERIQNHILVFDCMYNYIQIDRPHFTYIALLSIVFLP